LRTALRGSATGCVNADAVGLNRRERERCDEQFGAARAKGDPLSGMDAGKRRALDAQAAAQEAYRRYQDAPMGPGVDPERPKGADCKSAVIDFEGSNPSPTTITSK
ncbi:hypothetical protein, partial [Enterobacter asburiae]